MPDLDDLSERELEILNLVAKGNSNKEIARDLHISANTVKVHLRNIFTKLEVSSRTEATYLILSTNDVEEQEPPTSTLLLNNNQVAESFRGFPLGFLLQKPWLVILGVILLLFAGFAISRGFQSESEPNPAEQPFSNSPATGNRWEARADLPTPRSGLAVAVYEESIYAIAGESDLGVTAEVSRYIPEMDEWVILSPKPTPVSDVQAAVIGGLIYLPGGELQSGQVTDILEVYDPREDTWTQVSPLPIPLSAYSSVAFEGQMYVFGGWNGKNFLNDVYIFDPDQNVWNELTPMPIKRGYSGAVVAGGKIFVFGGFDGEQALSDNYVYFPERDQGGDTPWEEASPMPEGRYGMGSAVVADVIHIIGGKSDSNTTFSQMEYLPREDRWEIAENPFGESWSNLGVAPIGTQIYAVGGALEENIVERNFVYQVMFVVLIPIVR